MSDWKFDRNLFEVKQPEEIPLDDFFSAMQRETFACFRGIVSPEAIRSSLDLIRDRFDRSKDAPRLGHGPDAVRSNFQKLLSGGESRTGNDDARLFRAFYNPIWEDDIWGLRDSFIELARVRNKIASLPLDFAIDKIEDNGLWTASRFHQYPAGGGFFRRHTDYVVKDVADEKDTSFFQVVLTLTKKGEHFHDGGAFVDIGEDRVCLDDYSEPGDIVIYDGRTVHGVEDIDPDVVLDLDTINGRLAGFATLYKKM